MTASGFFPALISPNLEGLEVEHDDRIGLAVGRDLG
jgi:hypothetical protein